MFLTLNPGVELRRLNAPFDRMVHQDLRDNNLRNSTEELRDREFS
jgi:hypothetical protein